MTYAEINLILIDSSSQRRAVIARALDEAGLGRAAFACVRDSEASLAEDRIVLIEDRGNNIDALVDLMARRDLCLPFIAFAMDPAARAIGRAVAKGAIDYLRLPMAIAEIEEAALAGLQAHARFGQLADGAGEGPGAAGDGTLAPFGPQSFALHRANMLGRIGKPIIASLI
ncbi:hypothetical protein [Novosphingobium album (ex Liu et al. 2023)]|uniref:Response regulator n=1 Tax=Novosphingobium album (ex Liu et al. 2023) TaxID=3031130 RepID=A0ABT5WVY0_9SPHN|nr:hypothetical protein [Novosphingobium album (ex Liu et al. 2023)]MDE8654017.1 hypothetical protein [Novosphingobium album (ex Liu et al. 2023)]